MMQSLLDKANIQSEELETLLKEREAGKVDFILVDVREDMEYQMGHIKGVDRLLPTSSFGQWAEKFAEENKDKTVIFTCRTGSRSGQVQHIFKSHGLEHMINHEGGIVSYHGEIEK
jgi:rhodanese-related sulfurtransferase